MLSIDCEWIQAFDWAVDVIFNIFLRPTTLIYILGRTCQRFSLGRPLDATPKETSCLLFNWTNFIFNFEDSNQLKCFETSRRSTQQGSFSVQAKDKSQQLPSCRISSKFRWACLSFDRKIYLEIFNQFKDEKHFDEKVLKSKTPVVVDFFATWCNPCKMLTPRIETVVSEHNGKVSLAKVSCYRVIWRDFQCLYCRLILMSWQICHLSMEFNQFRC